MKERVKFIAATSLCIGAVAASVLYFSWLSSGDPWSGLPKATCMKHPNGCFCETINSGWIKQPVNSLSSLGFIVVGFIVLYLVRKNGSMPKVWGVLLGLCAILIGLGSTFYHASLTFVGQFLDVAGMHILCLIIIFYSLRGTKRSPRAALASFTLCCSIVLAFLWLIPDSRRYMFAVLLVAGIVFEVSAAAIARLNMKTSWLWVAISVMVVSYGVWILDNQKILCNPQSVFQGHSVWHIGCAVAIYFLARYYLSEDENASAKDG